MTDTNAAIATIAGLSVLRVKGSPYEMGRQHGEAFADAIAQGVVPVFGCYTDTDPQLSRLPAEQRAHLAALHEAQIYAPLRERMPQAYRDELRGIADGAGLDEALVFRGNMLSELLQLALQIKDPGLGFDGSAGCTGFAASGVATASGELIHAKNTDYRGYGLWERFALLTLLEPDDGYRYLRVTSAGLIKGNTSLNEHGISIGGHFLYSSDVSAQGLAFTVLENEVMRKARTLDEAVALIESATRAGAFAFIISDGNSGEAIALECTRSEVGKRRLSNGAVGMSNIACASARLKEADILLGAGIARNPLSRMDRMTQLLMENSGNITIEKAMDFLADHYDMASARERAVAHTIANIGSVASVAVRPAKKEVWVGVGPVPASNNRFIGLDCAQALQGEGWPQLCGEYRSPVFADPKKQSALRQYARAAALYDRKPDALDQILTHLYAAQVDDRSEPTYWRMAGRLQLLNKQYALAASSLEVAVSIAEQGSNEIAEAYLLLGHAFDLLCRRRDAQDAYQEVLRSRQQTDSPWQQLNPLLTGAAEIHAAVAFTREGLAGLAVSFPLLSGWE